MAYINSPEQVVTNPDVFSARVVRVAPNERYFPYDADIVVETEPEDYHVLTFRVGDEGATKRIFLASAEPPLEGTEVTNDRTFRVERDILTKGAEFSLYARGSNLAKTSFKAVTMLTNVDIINSPFQR